MSEQLRTSIKRASVTRYRIAKETGVSQAALSRFAAGETMLALEHVDALCVFLGLELTPSRQAEPATKRERKQK